MHADLVRDLPGAGLPRPANRRWPIRIDLAGVATHIAGHTEESLLRYLADRISARSPCDIKPMQLDRWLTRYPWLLILDGLDEVASAAVREQVVRTVSDFLVDAASRAADVVVVATTRPQGYADEFDPSDFARLELAELSTHQALRYADRLALERHPDNLDMRTHIRKRLEEASETAMIARLMRTPLQVTIMSRLLEGRQRVPQERYALFNAYFNTRLQPGGEQARAHCQPAGGTAGRRGLGTRTRSPHLPGRSRVRRRHGRLHPTRAVAPGRPGTSAHRGPRAAPGGRDRRPDRAGVTEPAGPARPVRRRRQRRVRGAQPAGIHGRPRAHSGRGRRGHRPAAAAGALCALAQHMAVPAALGGQRIAGAGQLLLLDQQLLAGGIPLLRGHDQRSLHRGPSSLRYSSTTSNSRPHRRACDPSSPPLRSASWAGARAGGSSPPPYAAARRFPRAPPVLRDRRLGHPKPATGWGVLRRHRRQSAVAGGPLLGTRRHPRRTPPRDRRSRHLRSALAA
jgi:hypothetical protein